MNKRTVNRDGKMEVIRNILNNNNNIDYIFLIDVNNIEYVVIEGYNKYTDNRNILFVKNNIFNSVSVKNNWFSVDNGLNFVYLIPKDTKENRNNIIDLINKKEIVIGDINLKSNKELFKYVDNVYGESSLQTLLINKRPIKYRKFFGPSDHNIVSYTIKVKTKFNTELKLCQVDDNVSKKIVKDILDGKLVRYKPKIKFRKYNYCFNDREKLNEEILNEYIDKNVIKVYKKYNYLWKNYRREPFLGTYVNDNIVKTFANHLREDKNKQYYNMIIDDDIKFDSDIIKKTKSKALNYDYLKLETIYKAIDEYVYENKETNNSEKNERVINNVLKQINNCKFKLRANTFFLLKNKKLQDYNDVRMIVIMPTLVKIYETLIFDEVENFLSDLIGKEKYQWGGVRKGSTYRALFDLRDKMSKFDNIKALLLLDMTKGYDSVNLDKLLAMINKIQDKRIKTLLKNWVFIVKNLDIVMNNNTIKKTRGIPMGLSLSPIMFVFYVHNAIQEFKKNNLVLYIDDIATFIPDSLNNNEADKFIEDLIKKLAEYDLEINKKKSVMISKDDHFIKKYKKIFDFKDSEKYLGRELKIGLDGKIAQDDRFYFDGKKIKGKPAWINFSIKRLIYNGALDARFRYKFFMWPTDNILVKKKIFENSWNLYKSGDTKYSYVQMALVSTNLFRYLLDPIFIRECYYNIFINNIDRNIVNNSVRNKLYVRKPQIDKIIDVIHIAWNDSLNFNSDLDWIEIAKDFINNIWANFKIEIYNNYMREKANNNIFVFDQLNINSKFIKNFAFINDLVFNHINRNKNKQIILWKFLDYFSLKYYTWLVNDNNYNVNSEIEFQDFDIKKDLFNVNMDNWEEYAKNKNIRYWGVIEDLIKLEKHIANHKNIGNMIDKEFENVYNKVFKFGVKSLNEKELKLYDMNVADAYYYKKNRIKFKKKNLDYLKCSFYKILKLFIIFDTIYGDKYYNSVNLEELRINLLLKIDSLDLLADKLIEVIKIEPFIEGLGDDIYN